MKHSKKIYSLCLCTLLFMAGCGKTKTEPVPTPLPTTTPPATAGLTPDDVAGYRNWIEVVTGAFGWQTSVSTIVYQGADALEIRVNVPKDYAAFFQKAKVLGEVLCTYGDGSAHLAKMPQIILQFSSGNLLLSRLEDGTLQTRLVVSSMTNNPLEIQEAYDAVFSAKGES